MISIALILQLLGLTLIHRSWKQAHRSRLINLIAGCLLITALWFWQQAVGWEYGISAWFLVVPFVAWGFVIAGRESRKKTAGNHRSNKPQLRVGESGGGLIAHNGGATFVFTGLLAGPFAFMASFASASLLVLILDKCIGLSEANQLVLNLATLLLLWAISIFLVFANFLRAACLQS
ncbi:MAG: hypothetical protein KUG83_00770 [Gammaproteobacteria bacterium]|nr:hypothetical protein [Gammaproteobacteria bacterium]